MAEQLELTEQLEHPNIENTHTLTPSTSNPSGNPSERTHSKEKISKSIKLKIFPFSWPEIFDSKFVSLLSKKDVILKKIIKAIEEDQKQDNTQLGNYYKPYIKNLHGCLYLQDAFILTTG